MAQRQAHSAFCEVPALCVLLFLAAGQWACAKDPAPVALYPKPVEQVLTTYCFDCHGEGMEKGKVSFDQFESRDQMLTRHDLWLAVLKNIRAGIMPPQKKPRPNETEQHELEHWIKTEMFGIDLREPDPGR